MTNKAVDEIRDLLSVAQAPQDIVDKVLDRVRSIQDGQPKKIPLTSQDRPGWTIDLAFLKGLSDHEAVIRWNLQAEEVEAVILALHEKGYVSFSERDGFAMRDDGEFSTRKEMKDD